MSEYLFSEGQVRRRQDGFLKRVKHRPHACGPAFLVLADAPHEEDRDEPQANGPAEEGQDGQEPQG
jgi:hypothetical protein